MKNNLKTPLASLAGAIKRGLKMKVKNYSIFVLAVCSLVSTSVFAGETSGNIGVSSNYLFRGLTQTLDQSAVTGGLDYAADSGFYAGTWVANVDFGGGGQTEMDIYAGFGGTAGKIDYDVGYAYYYYPRAADAFGADFSFGELYASVTYDWLTFGFYYVTNSQTDDTLLNAEAYIEGDLYYHLDGSWALNEEWTLDATFGNQTFDNDGVFGADLNYTTFQVGLTKSAGDYGDLSFSIAKSSQAAWFGNDDNLIPVIAWSKSF